MHQVLIALLVFCQQDQMAVFPVCPALPIVHVLLSHIHFAADHRHKARCLGRFVKFHRAIHHAVVRHGDVRHAHFFGTFHQFRNPRSAIQQAILCMHM